MERQGPHRPNSILQIWRRLGITTKFGLAFGVLLAMIVLITMVSLKALTIIRSETDSVIINSTDIQRLILEMDRRLEKARRLEGNFFLRYPTMGYSAAYQKYAEPAAKQVRRVSTLNTELQTVISAVDVSEAWRASGVDLNLYFLAAKRHSATIIEATDLVARLAADEIGQQAQLALNSSFLKEILQVANFPGLLILYREMQSFEKDYLLVRQRPLMQSAFNAASPLRKAIKMTTSLETGQKTKALIHLDNYLAAAVEILELDVAIRSKFNEFDLQTEAIDPIMTGLLDLSRQEVERARTQMKQTGQLVTDILLAIALAGLALSIGIARLLHNSVTRNVVKLDQVASKLTIGNLEIRAKLDSDDEVGRLAASFNAMASRLQMLVDDLEQQVASRTSELTIANEKLQEENIERKRAQDSLKKHSERLEEVVQERTRKLKEVQEELLRKEKLAILGQLAGGIAHELRNPLGVLSNAIYFLNLSLPGASVQTKKHLDIIDSEIHRSEKIISDLLSFSRIRLTEESELEDVATSALVARVLAEHPPPEHVKVSTQLDPDLPTALVNYQQLVQVLTNLITNAYQAMPDGGTLTISNNLHPSSPSFTGKPKVVIAVQDTGYGIPAESLDKVFEPLFTTKAKGIGLGLAVSRNLLEANEGYIEVESERTKGSTFTITLPTRVVDDKNEAETQHDCEP